MKLDFAGVGSGKSGTTWLAACLAEHPGICLSVPKELNYFTDYSYFPGIRSNFGKGAQWLEGRFAHRRPGQLLGEISPVYMLDPAVPARLAEHNKGIRLIFNYREPVSRLYSLYFQLRRLYPVPATFETFLESSPAYLGSGYYGRQTARFLDAFPRTQLHFIFFEDIAQSPRQVLRDLFGFLGVDTAFSAPSAGQRINERGEPRSTAARDALHRVRLALNSSAAAAAAKEMLARAGAERLYHYLLNVNMCSKELPPMLPETRARLAATYADDVAHLARLTGRDLSAWLGVRE